MGGRGVGCHGKIILYKILKIRLLKKIFFTEKLEFSYIRVSFKKYFFCKENNALKCKTIGINRFDIFFIFPIG
jgi:hypothetical protein